jgi:hypothetical protein
MMPVHSGVLFLGYAKVGSRRYDDHVAGRVLLIAG